MARIPKLSTHNGPCGPDKGTWDSDKGTWDSVGNGGGLIERKCT